MHRENSFVTLTFDDDHLPEDGSVSIEHMQKFLKRLRKANADKSIRYMLAGEYGERLGRPHYHLCLFGYRSPDLEKLAENDLGQSLYASSELQRLWPYGHSVVGELTTQSASYTARYVVKKITGICAEEHYGGKQPEFGSMSLKPGLGATWFDTYWRDVYPHDFVVVEGKKMLPPRYYDKLLESRNPAMYQRVKNRRISRATEHIQDQTPERRHDRYVVKKAAINNLKETL